jgi:GNAT superfamily N-acetyltransferase
MLENLSIRPLNLCDDRDAVFDLCKRAADYIQLEYGHVPEMATVEAFIADVVPGGDVAQSPKRGAEADGQLYGIADMGFGYPNADDAYIGLLLLDPAARGQGVGQRILAELTQLARARGVARQLVAVLEANPRGFAFWQRQGFVVEKLFEPALDDPLQHRRLRMVRAL